MRHVGIHWLDGCTTILLKNLGTVFEFGDVFCLTDFLSGFLFMIRGRVRVKVGDGGWF